MKRFPLFLLLTLVVSAPGAYAQFICPSAAVLQAPGNNSTVPAGNLLLVWEGSASATSYDVYAGVEGSPLTRIATTREWQQLVSVSGGRTYNWYVLAQRDGCNPRPSQTFRFTTTSSCATEVPTLVSPADKASVTQNVTFTWNAVKGAASYRIVLTRSDGATSAGTTAGTTTTVALGPATYTWFVQAFFSNDCPLTESARRTVVVTGTACPTGIPTLIAPAPNATSVASPVTFQWGAVPSAVSYRVLASINGGALQVVGTTASTTLSVPLATGSVEWMVQALFAGECAPTISPRSTFTITSGACDRNPATTLQVPPNNGEAGGLAEFRWTPVTGATGYQLYLAAAGSSTFELAATTTETTLRRIVPVGAAQWFVTTQFLGCPDTKSATFRFTVPTATCADASIRLLAPAENSRSASPVTFNWTEVTNASAYRVWASVNGSAPTLIARTTTPTATVNLPSGTIDWYAEALRNFCPSVTSPTGRFVIDPRANCASNVAPTLVAPRGEIANAAVDFTWNATPNAVGYKVWLSFSGRPFEDIGFATGTTLRRELPPGPYSWYVETFFAGCPSVASARTDFVLAGSRCTTAAPAIVNPPDNSNAQAPVRFAWTQVRDADAYRVYAFFNGATTPIVLGVTTETTLVRALPPEPVIWFVEAIFRTCPSTRSPRARFAVPQSTNCSDVAPTLVMPAKGASNVNSQVDFVWNPVNGAVRYVVMAKFAGGNVTPLGETDATTFSRRLPPGSFEWWVVALFAGCRATESAHATFTIPRPAECDSVRPLPLTPANGSRDVTAPVVFTWTPVARAGTYKLWASIDGGGNSVIATVSEPRASVSVPPGRIRWFVEAFVDGCPPLLSATNEFRSVSASAIACTTPAPPVTTVIGQSLANRAYSVRWTPLPNVSQYEVQESTRPDFADAATTRVTTTTAQFIHSATAPTPYFYRVRGVSSCRDERGSYSRVVNTFVVPANRPDATVEFGGHQPVVQTIFLEGGAPGTTFTATSNKSWLRISPSSGPLPQQGITLTLTSDPSRLPIGTSNANVSITYSTPTGPFAKDGPTSPKSVSVSVSLVTPVDPGARGTSPDDALIIPAIAHAEGANNSLFQSDIRISNLGADVAKYLLIFTPSGVDGTQNGLTTEIEIEPGQTAAYDDILGKLFPGSTAGGTGTLEVRPITSESSSFFNLDGSANEGRTTAVSSRTYNATPNGTFGQYIPAVPVSQFIRKASESGVRNILSLQQIAQSPKYRTNIGFVEAAGEPVDLQLRFLNSLGVSVFEQALSLQPGEHRQLNSLLGSAGITLDDGRMEVEVLSDTGRVTAYASVVDASTNDPLMVSPVLKSSLSARTVVVPGVAELTGLARFLTDLRLYNAGATPVTATLTYRPLFSSGGGTAKERILAAGETAVFDNVIASFYGLADTGGVVVVTTPENASLVATARTYTFNATGTYGQFIPGVTPSEAVGAGERTLQLLQLEQSDLFRTNVGFVETSGNSAKLEVTVTHPDARTSSITILDVGPFGSVQYPLTQFVAAPVYNGRIAVRVLEGTGRVTGYASLIDSKTQDPTYIPAQ